MSVSQELFETVLDQETRSAGSRPDAPAVSRLAALYQDIGFDDEAAALVERSKQHQVDRGKVLPILIEGLLRREGRVPVRELQRVTTEALSVLGSQGGAARLRLPVARALTALQRIPDAAGQWGLLIRDDILPAEAWIDVARHLAFYGAEEALAEKIEEHAAGSPSRPATPLVAYCLARIRMEQERPKEAVHCLRNVDLKQIHDPDILRDAAVIAWRLRNWETARAAAGRAMELDDSSLTRSVLASVMSFSGGSAEFEGSLELPPRVIELLEQEPGCCKASRTFWGAVLQYGEVFRLYEIPWDSGTECEMDLSETPEKPLITWSIMPDPRKNSADPFQVLPLVDWSVPHIMVTRDRAGCALHAFRHCPRDRFHEWQWDEAKLEKLDEEGLHRNEEHRKRIQLWNRIMDELTRIPEDVS